MAIVRDRNSGGGRSVRNRSARAKTLKNRPFPRLVKVIRIAVTGDVWVTELEKEIIDTPDFQRLRGVRQLGPSVHVYPTALHTRFDHALGTLEMADRMVMAIRDDNDEYKRKHPESCNISNVQRCLARLYGLLHDVTHVPFGHTIEDELHLFEKHDAPNSPRFKRFLGEESPIGKLIMKHLSPEDYDRFKKIYQTGQSLKLKDGDEFIYDLVSNTVCADLLDYVRRDSHFCNLDIYFEYRFLNSLYLKEKVEKNGEKRKRMFIRLWKGESVIPRRDTLTDLTRLLEARYMIAERVYFHHAKIISGTMIGRAIQEAKRANELEEKDLYSHSDDTLVQFLAGHSKLKIAQKLAQAYRERRLYKAVYKFTETDFAHAQSQDHSTAVRDKAMEKLGNPDERYRIENELADEIGLDDGDVLIYAPSPKMNMKLAQMNVVWEGQPKELKDIDDPVVKPRLTTILDAHRNLWGIYLLVNPDFSDRKGETARQAFEARFLTSATRRGARKRSAHYKEMVRTRVRNRDDLAEMSPAAHEKAVDRAARELEGCDFADLTNPASLGDAIDRHFHKKNRQGVKMKK